MHRRPTLTQRDGLFRTTRFVLYGNRVRVIRVSPLVRDDQYIPLEAVDPDQRLMRRPDLREALLAAALVVPGLLGAIGWPSPMPLVARTASALLALAGAAVLLVRGGPVRTYVAHGALQLLADVPNADAVRHFVERVVDASKAQVQDENAPTPLSVAAEIRRLHGHLEQGRLSRDGFTRHKQRLLRSLRSHLP